MSDEPLIAPIYVPCEMCGSEGRILVQAPTYWEPYNERDDGPCPACDGTGVEMIEDCEAVGSPDASGDALGEPAGKTEGRGDG